MQDNTLKKTSTHRTQLHPISSINLAFRAAFIAIATINLTDAIACQSILICLSWDAPPLFPQKTCAHPYSTHTA
jgi:hypothetical protein